MNRRHALYLAAALLLSALLFVASKAKPYEEVIEHGPAPEVQHNPYLAAGLFLSTQGRTVSHVEGLPACSPHHLRTRFCCFWVHARR